MIGLLTPGGGARLEVNSQRRLWQKPTQTYVTGVRCQIIRKLISLKLAAGLASKRKSHGMSRLVGPVNGREHFDNDAALFPADQWGTIVANGLQEILNLQGVVMSRGVDCLKVAAVLVLKFG